MRRKESFLEHSLKNLKTVGTVTRSSSYLCNEVIKQIDWSEDLVVLELGAGDGVITKHILKKMSKNSKLIAFEINSFFCEEMRKIKDERLIVIQEDASGLNTLLKGLNIQEVDHVISAIPFVILPEPIALQIIQAAFDHLAFTGKFIQIHYSLLAKKLYEKIFGNVMVKFVPFNLPPAFLLIMQKAVVKLPVCMIMP